MTSKKLQQKSDDESFGVGKNGRKRGGCVVCFNRCFVSRIFFSKDSLLVHDLYLDMYIGSPLIHI